MRVQNGVMAGIAKVIRHPNYRIPALYADIALLKLSITVEFNKTIRPACLYQMYDTVPEKAWVSGWGVTEFGKYRILNYFYNSFSDLNLRF